MRARAAASPPRLVARAVLRADCHAAACTGRLRVCRAGSQRQPDAAAEQCRDGVYSKTASYRPACEDCGEYSIRAPGGALWLRAYTNLQCMRACDAHPRCLGAALHLNTGRCFLLSARVDRMLLPPVPDAQWDMYSKCPNATIESAIPPPAAAMRE